MGSATYHLNLLGGVSLEGHHCSLIGPPTRNKSLALLILLAVTPGRSLPRETITDLLWPRSNTQRARHSLNVIVYEVRKALGREALVTGNGSLRLNPDTVTSDVERFDHAVSSEQWNVAEELYAGGFLEGFHYHGSQAFEQWVESQRWRLERSYLTVLESRAERSRDAETAVARWRKLLEHDPASAKATMGFMRSLEATGRRAEAIDAAYNHRILLLDEYGANPDPDVEELADRLREEPASIGLPLDEGTPRSSVSHDNLPKRRPRALAWVGAVAAIVLLSLFTIGSDDYPLPNESSRILVAGFENLSGDPELDDLGLLAADWIAQELSKTGFVHPVLPMGELRSDGFQADDRPLEVAERLGAKLVLIGHYHVQADSITATAMIARIPTGEVVRTLGRVTVARSNPALLAERLRERATASLATIVNKDLTGFVPAGASQPPTYEAYRIFARGIERFTKREYRAAAAAFHKAASQDTTFTLPLVYAALSHRAAVYYPDPTRRDQRHAELADSVRGWLQNRRDQLPPWESAWVDYFETEDSSALRKLTDMTPEPRWLLLLARKDLQGGRASEALETLDDLEAQGPVTALDREYFTTRMHALHLAQEYDREYEVVKEFKRRYPFTRPIPPRTYPPELYEIRVLAALDRTQEVERSLNELMERALNPWEVQLPLMEVEIHGHGDLGAVKLVRQWFLEQVHAEAPIDDPEELWRWNRAVALRDLGRLEEAQAHFQRLLARASTGSDNPIIFLGALGQIAADLGDREEALRYDRRLEALDLERFHEPGLTHAASIQRINIAIALAERQKAIAMLGEAVEDGMPLFANGHPEMFHLRWLELKDDPAYQALVRPR